MNDSNCFVLIVSHLQMYMYVEILVWFSHCYPTTTTNVDTSNVLGVSRKGAKVYPASRRRSNKRVGLKGQLAPYYVPWLKNYIMAYKRLSTSLGSKTLNNTSFGLGRNQNLRPSCRRPPTRTFHTPVGTLSLTHLCTCLSPQSQWWQ